MSKIVSLKKVRREGDKLIAPCEVPKELYPSFTIYEDVPKDVFKFSIGEELVAKIKICTKEKREGNDARESMGFEVISVELPDQKEA
jgi:hypothetical protein